MSGEFAAKPLYAIGCKGQLIVASKGCAIIDESFAGAALRFGDCATRPVGFGTLGIELEGGLDVLEADIGLAGFVVDDGAIGEGCRVARVDFNGAVQVGEGVVVGFDKAVAEAATGVGGGGFAVEFDGACEVSDRGGEVADAEVGVAAQDVEFGVAVVEGDGSGEVFNGVVVAADFELG